MINSNWFVLKIEIKIVWRTTRELYEEVIFTKHRNIVNDRIRYGIKVEKLTPSGTTASGCRSTCGPGWYANGERRPRLRLISRVYRKRLRVIKYCKRNLKKTKTNKDWDNKQRSLRFACFPPVTEEQQFCDQLGIFVSHTRIINRSRHPRARLALTDVAPMGRGG